MLPPKVFDLLTDSIRSGALSLDNAYEEARIRKGQSETYEARFNALKATAPDLAELVVEGQLQLSEAQAALDQRVTQERREKMNTLAPSSRAGRYRHRSKFLRENFDTLLARRETPSNSGVIAVDSAFNPPSPHGDISSLEIHGWRSFQDSSNRTPTR